MFSALAALVAQLLIFKVLIRHGGLDPSFLTYASPLASRNFWAARAFIAVAVVLSISQPSIATAAWIFIMTAAAFQYLSLMIFNRQHTQPATYYIILVVTAVIGLISHRSASLILPLALAGIAEVYLHNWQQHRQQRYDNWVKACALQINRQFRHLAEELEPTHWRWVLHVAVTENIARPAIVRLAERLYYMIKRPGVISTGIMQISAERPLSDTESILAGSKRIAEILQYMPAGLSRSDELRWLAKHYNGSYGYAKYLHLTDAGVNQAFQEIS